MMRKGVIIAIIVILVLIGVFTVVNFLPLGPKKIVISMREYKFSIEGIGTVLNLKAGEKIVLDIRNDGVIVHELMIVRDKDEVVSLAEKVIEDLRMKYGDDVEAIEMGFEEWHEELHHDRPDLVLVSIDLEPGESSILEFTFDEPGTYWFICLEIDATFPETHAHNGMILKIVVSG